MIPIKEAVAVIQPVDDSQISGKIIFTADVYQGIKILVNLNGLDPGKHGFHLHTYGDCSNLEKNSAGPIFDPYGKKHAGPSYAEHKLSDFGNLTVDSSGNAHMEWVDVDLAFKGKNSIIGRSVLIHQNENDMLSQPDGNVGPAIAYGVIGIAKPE